MSLLDKLLHKPDPIIQSKIAPLDVSANTATPVFADPTVAEKLQNEAVDSLNSSLEQPEIEPVVTAGTIATSGAVEVDPVVNPEVPTTQDPTDQQPQ